MSNTKKTIACFGATGGCVAVALACALKAGHTCTALARSPQKLLQLLVADHGVTSSIIEQQLTVYEGDVKDPDDVAKALVNPRDQTSVVDVILSGVGAYPTFQWSIRQPFPLTDPTICEDAVKTIYKALSDLSPASQKIAVADNAAKKPLLVVISTAGCGRSRGIPLPICLPYHYFLGSPLADKQRMEEVVLTKYNVSLADFVIMRPLVLTDGRAKGDDGLRIGWEWGMESEAQKVKEPGPVLGYSVSRKDVGAWIFEKVIVQGGWEGKCAYLTY